MKSPLQDELLVALSSADYFGRGREALVRFEQSGGGANEAYMTLERLRAAAGDDEAREDRILELMDLTVGFCAASKRIWLDESALVEGGRWELVDAKRELRGVVTILGHELHVQAGRVVHVSVSGVESAAGAVPFGEVGHLPMSPASVACSIGMPVAGRAEALELEGVGIWREVADRGEAGVFAVPVADAVRFAMSVVVDEATTSGSD